ncbi:MAG: TlpA family protein disulfide reductase [Myxococcales bacterium]|nr:TlpA family protein disulfide reductase [Myxococcales bacterium]
MTRTIPMIASFAAALLVGACAQTDADELVLRRRPPAVADTGADDASSSAMGGSICERACARVYDTCRRSLSNGAGVLSRSQCVSECNAGAFSGAARCLGDVQCTTDAIVGCFSAIPIAQDGGAPSDSGSAPSSPIDAQVPPVDAGSPPPVSDSGVPSSPPSTYSCATACGHIYDDCRVVLSQSGTSLTRAQCEAHCAATNNYRSNAACLSTMACTMDAFYACLMGSGGSSPPPPPPADAGVPSADSGAPMTSCSPPTTGFCTSVGCFARPTTFTAIDGASHALYGPAYCAASATVVIVSAGWCGVCQREAPTIERDITAAYRARGVRVLTLVIENPDRSPGTVAYANTWHSRYSLTSTTVVDPSRDWLRAVTISGVPAVTVLDRTGRIRHHTSGISVTQVRSVLDSILSGG